MSDVAMSEVPMSQDGGEAFLVRRDTRAGTERWPLPGGEVVTVGRSETADVRILEDPLVSRLHATLQRVAGQWTVEDDGLSRNGTWVNGRRISGRVRLRDRDRLGIGSAVLVFCAPPPSTELATVAGGGLPTVRRLTEPQLRVLTALCAPYREGAPYPAPAGNQAIATELSLSLDAVKTHLRVLFHTFGIESLPQNRKRARLAELALELGLVG